MKTHIKINKYKLFYPTVDDISKSMKSPYCIMGYFMVFTNSPLPTDIKNIKECVGGNEKYIRDVLRWTSDKIKPKWVGRPPKPKKTGRPSFKSASDNTPPITALNCKTLYLPNKEKIDKFSKEIIAMVCDHLEITEIQFRRRCRMFENKYKDDLTKLAVSLQALPG